MLTWDELNESERKLAEYLNSVEGDPDFVDYGFRDMVFDCCREQNLVEDFLKFVEEYNITNDQDILAWYIACVESDEYDEEYVKACEEARKHEDPNKPKCRRYPFLRS